ncbi:MAG: GAF domain-containing protein, partial [Blastochloris sp.]|nr:GAF domain-containing protein [Blastochloris sp.]
MGAALPPLPNRVSVPIVIRGETIGTIDAMPPEGIEFTDGDLVILRAVSERVALAIEAARLFEETQSSLSETFTLYQLSRYLNEAETLEDVLQAIITSVMHEASSGQIAVFDDYLPGEEPEWVFVTADWSNEQAEREFKLTGLELQFANHPIFQSMRPDQVLLIQDASRDARVDDVFSAIIQDTHAGAMVLIPFSVRGVWRGVIFIQFAQPRTFSEQEGRIYSALIDQAGIAIDNRMLLRENEAALSEIEVLYTASRQVNMATTPLELVRAAMTTNHDPTTHFELGLFEGALDETGWPTQLRIVARSSGIDALTVDELYEMAIGPDSPIRRREAQIVVDRDPNAPDASPFVRHLRATERRFAAAFPLFSANQPIALFFIVSSEPRDLSTNDTDVYRALTGQMSTVLQNRRLLEQTELALDETRRLYVASRAIVAASDAAAIYDAAARSLTLANPAITRISVLRAYPSPTSDAPFHEYASVWLRSDDFASDLAVGSRISSGAVPLARIITENDGLTRYNTPDAPMRPSLRGLLERAGSVSALLAPIQLRQRWFGVLLCESDRPNSFDPVFANFVQAVTDQMAVALESMLLFAEAQAQAQRALALAEAAQLATRMGDEFAASINEVFLRVAEPANYDRWMLALVDEDTQDLRLIASQTPGLEAWEQHYEADLEAIEASLHDTYRLNKSLLINDPELYPSFVDLRPTLINVVGKHLTMPVRVQSASGERGGIVDQSTHFHS